MSDTPDYTVSVSADDEDLAMKKAREMLAVSGTSYESLAVFKREELDEDIAAMSETDGRYAYTIEVVK